MHEQISGTVEDDYGRPLEGAVVAVFPQDGGEAITVVTDEAGMYSISRHPNGGEGGQKWHVAVRYRGRGGKHSFESQWGVEATLLEGESRDGHEDGEDSEDNQDETDDTGFGASFGSNFS